MKKGRKIRAAVDIEMILMISLSVAALFLIFNLFNTNLARITANKNINNLSPENTLRTEYKPIWDKDPTQTQVNVQIVGDHGLQWYHEQAQYTIESLGSKPKGSLDNSEIIDLAKALTVFGESINQGKQSDELINTCIGAVHCGGGSNSYKQLGDDYGIIIKWEKTSFGKPGTNINGQPNDWVTDLPNEGTRPNLTTYNVINERIENIKYIKSCTFQL